MRSPRSRRDEHTLGLPFEGAPYVSGSSTSHAAAAAITADLTRLQQKVLDHLRACVDGATDEEMQTALGMNPSTQRPRRIELVDRGRVKDSGKTRPTKSGKRATVWVAL